MSRNRKQNKAGRSNGSLGSFTALERYLINSSAWRDLKPTARAAYVEIASCYSGDNNGRLIISARQIGERLGMDKATASRAVSALVMHGFLFVTQRSSFQLKLKLSAEYRLTAFKCDRTGQLAAKTFMRWNPEIQNTVAWQQLCGCASATVYQKRRRKPTEQLHSCTLNGLNGQVHSCTGAPHLHLGHRPDATHTTLNAPPASARQEAAGKASLHSVNQDNFQSLGGIALQSLAHLDKAMPSHLKSWQPTEVLQSESIPTNSIAQAFNDTIALV
jgi:hypothetical protein